LATWAGYEILWVACTAFVGDKAALKAVQGAVPKQDDKMSDAADKHWTPKAADFDKVSRTNQANVKALDEKSEMDIEVGGALVLVGGGHETAAVVYVDLQGDHESGKLTVKRSPFGAGSVVIKGNISASKQELIKAEIDKFSDKSVKFV
jgi:hypothetical protein